MRLIRVAKQRSRCADDIRAALASIGRAELQVGGIALLGVRSPSEDAPIDAVVVLPKGVLIVIGIDLPDPAMRLEAPLTARWKADGWPLVHSDSTVNPATEALRTANSVSHWLHTLQPAVTTVGTVLAVGPYVATVDQPPADVSGSVRVLHPNPTSMLAATVSLSRATKPLSVTQARDLVIGIAPDMPPPDLSLMTTEGFAGCDDEDGALTTDAPTIRTAHPRRDPTWQPRAASEPSRLAAAAQPTTAAQLATGSGYPPWSRQVHNHAPSAHPPSLATSAQGATGTRPTNLAAPNRPNRLPARSVQWLPLAALLALLALLVTAIVLATTSDEPRMSQRGPDPSITPHAPKTIAIGIAAPHTAAGLGIGRDDEFATAATILWSQHNGGHRPYSSSKRSQISLIVG